MIWLLLLLAQTRVSLSQVGPGGIQWEETPRLCVAQQIQAQDVTQIDFNVQDADRVTSYMATGLNQHECRYTQGSEDVLRSSDITTGTYTLKSFVPGQSALTYVLINRIDPAKAGTCGQPTCFAAMGALQEDADYVLVGNVLSFVVPLLPGDEVLIQWVP